jgi:small subunit ribosomal protein S8
LTRIRNAQAVKKESVSIPFSNFVFEIAKVLKREGFVGEIKKRGKQPKKELIISLKYIKEEPAISSIKMVSKPGQRTYKGYKDLGKVKGGRGIYIVSTSQGILSSKEAFKKKAGGEVICEIW